MYRNFKTFTGSFNDDGTTTIRLQGVETFP